MSELLNVEELFASNVFTVAKMRERLPKKVFQEVIRVMEHGRRKNAYGFFRKRTHQRRI